MSDFAERYPRMAFLLAGDQVFEGLTLDVWQQDSQLGNDFRGSAEQIQVIDQIRAGILGEAKHIRALGKPGLGKTRIVLETLKDEPSEILVPCQKHRAQLYRLLQHLFIRKSELELLNESHCMTSHR